MKNHGILIYIIAALTFFSSHDGSTVTIWICIGTVFIVLGASQVKKDK